MKTLYLECMMGAAGDMLMAALLELYDRPQEWIDQMNALGIPGIKLEYLQTEKCGIRGGSVTVLVNGQEEHSHDAAATDALDHDNKHGHEHKHRHEHSHHHADIGEIHALISALPVSEKVKRDAVAVYDMIAQAEAKVHGRSVHEVHFHEVGTKDALADVVGCCLLMEQLAPDAVMASPVHVGSGHVKCSHGILPVPAPATAEILKGVPVYGGMVQGELCTPTGAALLKYFVTDFAPMPTMCVEKIGYGMGKKDFPLANCLRAYWGDSALSGDDVVEISCNLDDMTGEAIGYAMDVLLEAGALDAFTTSITMKKGRPAVLLTCLCPPQQEHSFVQMLLNHTTTRGVRVKRCARRGTI